MEPPPLDEAPYRGLEPFAEEHWPYFFGRDDDRDLITANLIGSRLTILYGPSGVGKSSVLDAGVGHHVNEDLAEESRAEVGHPEFALAVFRSWRDDPIPGLLTVVRGAVERVAGCAPAVADSAAKGSLGDALHAMAEAAGLTILLVLDQFEEYFLYHPDDLGTGSFADQFPELVHRPNLRIHVMISIREDAVSKLDRFKGRIPGLFESTLRIDPLEREQARQAITRPLDTYNREHELVANPIRFEPTLVDAVLEGVKTGAIELEFAGRGRLDPAAGSGREAKEQAKRPVEAPFLQLVMTRVWDEERRLGSRLLRLRTFQDLGGAGGIVRKHLDEVLGRLVWSDRPVAEEALTYLVTPSGTKIALEPSFIAEKTGYSTERVGAVLERLAAPDCRVVRKLESPEQSATRYEVFHDVLARVVVDDYVPRIKRRRFRRWLAGMTTALLITVFLLVEVYWATSQTREALKLSRTASKKAEEALVQARDANERIKIQARAALSRQLGLQVGSALNERFDRALLLAAEAFHWDPSTFEARDGLMRAVNSRPGVDSYLHQSQGDIVVVAFAPDGKTLAAGFYKGETGGVVLWDVARLKRLGTPHH
jgi:hypothetical protein